MSGRARSSTAIALVALAAAASCDPVHDRSVDVLGGEAPGVEPGPLHRPGQPCLTCHDGALGDPTEFTIAGTIYVSAEDLAPAVGATVTVTGAGGSAPHAMVTNEAGNFYAEPREFTPVFPLTVAVTYRGVTAEMGTLVGRDGSCADCHSDPPGPASAGHVFIPPDGVTP
jgi:hypothetical protein